MKTRVSAHTVEVIITIIMALFGICAGYIFYAAIQSGIVLGEINLFTIILLLLILVLIALLGVILVLVRIWEKLGHK